MTTVPLARALTDAGYGARRRVVVLIKSGLVQVNGEVAESYTQPVDPTKDKIEVAGRRTGEETPRRVYIAMNKPEGYLSTTEDDRGRPTVIDLLPENLRKAGLHPAGRLDEDSTGLLILTNDGKLTYELTHPRFEHQKEYYVALTGSLPEDDQRRLEEGVDIEGQVTWPAKVRKLEGESPYSYSVIIHEGRKRQVRMMFAAVNQHVALLKRVRLGGLTLGSIPEGSFRELTSDEVRSLTRPPAKSRPTRAATTRRAPATRPGGDSYDRRPATARPRYYADRGESAAERPRGSYSDRPRSAIYDDRRSPAPPRGRYDDRPPRREYEDRRGPARPPYRSDRPEGAPERPRGRYDDRPPRREYEDRRGPARPPYRSDRPEGAPERTRGRYDDRPPRREYEDRRGPERPRYRTDRGEAPDERRAPSRRPSARDWDRDETRSSRPASRSRPMTRGDYEGGGGAERPQRRPSTRPPARGSGVSDRPGAARQGTRSPRSATRTQRPTEGGASRSPSQRGPATRGTQRRTSPGEGRRPPSGRR